MTVITSSPFRKSCNGNSSLPGSIACALPALIGNAAINTGEFSQVTGMVKGIPSTLAKRPVCACRRSGMLIRASSVYGLIQGFNDYRERIFRSILPHEDIEVTILRERVEGMIIRVESIEKLKAAALALGKKTNVLLSGYKYKSCIGLRGLSHKVVGQF